MISKRPSIHLLAGGFVIALFLIFLVMPSAAVVQEKVYLGRITALDPLSNTITIRAESQYFCDYSGAQPVCRFTPITPVQVVGTVPNEGIFTTFRNGDQVAAAIIGGSGSAWVGFALVIPGQGTDVWVATEMYGDPRTLPVTLAGDYQFEYSTLPDCTGCSGSVCRALSAQVILKSGAITVIDQSLNTGQSVRYSGRNDGSSVSILYLAGQADAAPCSHGAPASGLQPLSNFIIHVVPPIGQAASPGIVTQPTPMGIEPKVTPVATPAATQAFAGYLIPVAALSFIAVGVRRKVQGPARSREDQ